MSDRWERLLEAWRRLAPRERWLVGAALAAAALVLVSVGVVMPLQSLIARDAARLAEAEQALERMWRLRRDYDEIAGRLAGIEQRIRSAQGSNLRSSLDALAQQTGVRIDSMEPQASPADENYRETRLQVALQSVTLEQAARYLHAIESHAQPMSIKSLRLRIRPDGSQLLDLNFTVSSFEAL